jgi:hypothetical protein
MIEAEHLRLAQVSTQELRVKNTRLDNSISNPLGEVPCVARSIGQTDTGRGAIRACNALETLIFVILTR